MNMTSKIAEKNYYATRKKLVDARLMDILSASGYEDNGVLTDALRYTILSTGKRIRPIFMLAIYELFDDDIENALDLACAIELLHAGSLMLDDLPSMDNAKLRRGEKTSHTKFGESTTILASAALWIKCFELIANSNSERTPELLAETTKFVGPNGLIIGQYYDLEAKNNSFTLSELTRHYEFKTAALFRLAAKFGAVIANANSTQEKLLDEYARCLGIAFQIKDDLVDATQTAEYSGKDSHLDDINNKQNFVNTIGLEQSQKALQEYVQKATNALKDSKLNSDHLVALTNELI